MSRYVEITKDGNNYTVNPNVVPVAEFNYLTSIPCFKLADHDYPDSYYKYLGVFADGTLASTLEEFPNIQWLCVTYHGGSLDNIFSKNGVNLVSEDGTFDMGCTSVSSFNLVNGQWTDPWGSVYDVTVDTVPICQACYGSGS